MGTSILKIGWPIKFDRVAKCLMYGGSFIASTRLNKRGLPTVSHTAACFVNGTSKTSVGCLRDIDNHAPLITTKRTTMDAYATARVDWVVPLAHIAHSMKHTSALRWSNALKTLLDSCRTSYCHRDLHTSNVCRMRKGKRLVGRARAGERQTEGEMERAKMERQ